MNKLLSCRYNMDTNRVEARFEDGTTLAIDCIAVEDEYGNTPAQRAELDWLLYNKPLEYAQMVLRGEMERYLSLGCDHGRLEDGGLIRRKRAVKLLIARRAFLLLAFIQATLHACIPACDFTFPKFNRITVYFYKFRLSRRTFPRMKNARRAIFVRGLFARSRVFSVNSAQIMPSQRIFSVNPGKSA